MFFKIDTTSYSVFWYKRLLSTIKVLENSQQLYLRYLSHDFTIDSTLRLTYAIFNKKCPFLELSTLTTLYFCHENDIAAIAVVAIQAAADSN